MSIKDEKYSTRQRKFCCDTAVQGTNRNELERRHLLASKAEEIRPPLEAIPVHTVIDTANLCRTFPDIPEKTCCKVLERMVVFSSVPHEEAISVFADLSITRGQRRIRRVL